MVKILLKKQMAEIFRGYFYDAKNNKKRSLVSTILFIVLFVAIMAGLLGGMFTYLSLQLCPSFAAVNMSWMYFLIIGMIAIALGSFGSVFNTYYGLYMSKDNDLLLSMPIPTRSILIAKLATVYLMGLMYSAVAMVPAAIVYWIKVDISPAAIIGGIIYIILISVIVLILSCVLGWCVAKISTKLKNKSFITVIISLVFLALYYFVYFKAQNVINEILLNAALYGNKVKDSAYPMYLFGRIGEGDVRAMLIYIVIIGVVCGLTLYILSRSFIKIVTSSGNTSRIAYKEKKEKKKGELAALFSKEIKRFTSSSNYMLNCGLGSVTLVIAGIILVVKKDVLYHMAEMFVGKSQASEMICVLLAIAVCMVAAMNDMVVPSISLEGKSLWILQSMPVDTWNVLKAKMGVQLVLTGVPVLFCDICLLVVLKGSVAGIVLSLLIPVLFTLFITFTGLMLGILRPNFTWTNELAPIKQSLSVMIAMFGGWAVSIAMAVPYILYSDKINSVLYLLLIAVIMIILDTVLFIWLKKIGTKLFSNLG